MACRHQGLAVKGAAPRGRRAAVAALESRSGLRRGAKGAGGRGGLKIGSTLFEMKGNRRFRGGNRFENRGESLILGCFCLLLRRFRRGFKRRKRGEKGRELCLADLGDEATRVDGLRKGWRAAVEDVASLSLHPFVHAFFIACQWIL